MLHKAKKFFPLSIIMEIVSEGVSMCVAADLAAALFAIFKRGELCGGDISFHRAGGRIIMKGQRVNISWMQLITYFEKRDKQTYIGNGLTICFP